MMITLYPHQAQQGVISSSILLVPFIENQKGGY